MHLSYCKRFETPENFFFTFSDPRFALGGLCCLRVLTMGARQSIRDAVCCSTTKDGVLDDKENGADTFYLSLEVFIYFRWSEA